MAALHADNGNFREEVLGSDVPVLVDFWAPWCGPCRAMSPVVDEAADELAGKAKVVKVNVDEAPELSAMYGVRSIPMFAVFVGGDMMQSAVGGRPKQELVQMVESHLG